MTDKIIEKLKILRQKDKFSDLEWEKRGLNPSPKDLAAKMDALFNNCIDDLIEQCKTDKKDLKKVLKKGLGRFNKRDFDTEEKEFIGDYFCELGDVINVDFRNNINSWCYGSVLNILMKIFTKSKKTIETLSQNCTECDSKLDTFILKRRDDINYEAYHIVKCKSCNAYNMLDNGKGISEMNYGNYQPVEYLSKDEYTKEQAEIRMEQIKFFRQ
jgi:Domain of unknown function (DUF4844)